MQHYAEHPASAQRPPLSEKNLTTLPTTNTLLASNEPMFSVFSVGKKPSDTRAYGQARRYLLDKCDEKLQVTATSLPKDAVEVTSESARVRTSPEDDEDIVENAMETATMGLLEAGREETETAVSTALDTAVTHLGETRLLPVKEGLGTSVHSEPGAYRRWWSGQIRRHDSSDFSKNLNAYLICYGDYKCSLCEQIIEQDYRSTGSNLYLSRLTNYLRHSEDVDGFAVFHLSSMMLVAFHDSPFYPLQAYLSEQSFVRCWICSKYSRWDSNFYEHYVDCIVDHLDDPDKCSSPETNETQLARQKLRWLLFLRGCVGKNARDLRNDVVAQFDLSQALLSFRSCSVAKAFKSWIRGY